MSDGLSAFGTTFQVGDGASPEVFTAVAEVQKIGEFTIESDDIDLTHHTSPGGFEEVVMGILKTGVVPLTFNYIPTEATHRDASGGLMNLARIKALTNFRLVFPDSGSTTFNFSGYVKKVSIDAPHDGKIAGSSDIKITGEPTLA